MTDEIAYQNQKIAKKIKRKSHKNKSDKEFNKSGRNVFVG